MAFLRFPRPIVLSGLSAAIALLPVAALAFGTVNSLGQNAEHEKITRLALAPMGWERKSLDEIAGKSGSFGAVGAPDNPARGLMNQHSAHCDGGDYLDIQNYPHSLQDAEAVLAACQQWIFSNLKAAVTAAGEMLNADGSINDSEIPTYISCSYLGQSGRAKCNTLAALGLALHTSQDFYSHSNWTDSPIAGSGSIANPPGLNWPTPAAWLDPRGTSSFPDGLISGCYDGFPENLYCGDRVKHEVLNKDKGPINPDNGTIGQGTTPRAAGNGNFVQAVQGAVVDTQDKWTYFQERAVAVYGQERGDRIICAVIRDNPVKTCP